MALSAWFKKCPFCGSESIRENFRVESDEHNPSDYAVYGCNDCDEWFDQHTHTPDSASETLPIHHQKET